MKKIVKCILSLFCVTLLLMPTVILAVDQNYDTTVSFRDILYSEERTYAYKDMGINWQWTCQTETGYGQVEPQYKGFLGIYYSGGSSRVCLANLSSIYCIRWANANQTPNSTWRFKFVAVDNGNDVIKGYTRLLSEDLIQ